MNQNYKQRLLKLFVPIMISNLIAQVQMIIDRVFLGRMDVKYMTAIGNISSAIWTTMAVVFSLGIGSSILISQSVGEGKLDKARNYAASMFLYHNILPIILFLFWMLGSPLVFKLMGVSADITPDCVTYTRIYAPVFLMTGVGAAMTVCLQTSGNTKPLILYGFIRSVINIVLDYIMIYGKFGCPRMEITGAALATTIAEFLGAIYIAIVVVKDKKLFTRPSLKEVLHSKFGMYVKAAKLGVNTAVEDFAWNIGNLLIIKILNSISDTAAGIYSIVFSIELIATVVVGAIGNGTVTLTGEATGAKDFKLFRNIVKTAYIWAAMVAAFTLVMTILFPRQILGCFTTDQAIVESSALFLALVAVNMFAKSANIIVGNGIRGAGDTRWMLITQLIGTVGVVSIAALLVYQFHLGMIGIFVAVMTDEAFRALLNLVRFLKIRFDKEIA